MKLIDDNMQVGQIANFNFSGVRPEKLGATEYTLVTLVTDKTGSVNGFEGELLAMNKAVVEACRKSPRADYLMIRCLEFNTQVDETSGFMELTKIDEQGWQAPYCSGGTALFDATFNAVAATNEYAKILYDQDFFSNGIVFVVTDGDDNSSTQSASDVASEITRGVQAEYLESLMVVLIGVNATRYRRELEKFMQKGGLTQFVEVADATPSSLAKLAKFVSASISSQSQSLGTGGPSQTLVF